jgi:hypothetical protein
MYSIVLVMAMSGGADLPACHRNKCGCCGAPAPACAPAPAPAPAGCNGCDGGGCRGGHRLFGGLFHRRGGCCGCAGAPAPACGCSGTPVESAPAANGNGDDDDDEAAAPAPVRTPTAKARGVRGRRAARKATPAPAKKEEKKKEVSLPTFPSSLASGLASPAIRSGSYADTSLRDRLANRKAQGRRPMLRGRKVRGMTSTPAPAPAEKVSDKEDKE